MKEKKDDIDIRRHETPESEASAPQQFQFQLQKFSLSLSKQAQENEENRKSSSSNESYKTSPSKSIKSFFKNRASAYSIESISEEPEIKSLTTKHDSIMSHSHHPHSPSRSSGITTLLKPSFIKSKTLFQTLSSSGSANPSNTNRNIDTNLTSNNRPTTIEDFADTSSSSSDDENKTRDYDSESINSIIDDYDQSDTHYFHYGNSSNDQTPRKQKPHRPDSKFVFKEIFDEATSFIENDSPNTIRNSQHSNSNSTSTSTSNRNSGSSKRSSQNSNRSNSIRRNPSLKETRSIIELTLANSGNSAIPPPQVITDSPKSLQSSSFHSFKEASSQRFSGSSSNSNNTTGKFKIYDDSTSVHRSPSASSDINTRLTRNDLQKQKNVLSASSNIDCNRSSLLNEVSDLCGKHKEESTPMPTPSKSLISPDRGDNISSEDSFSITGSMNEQANILERPIRTKSLLSQRQTLINFDETLLRQSNLSNSSLTNPNQSNPNINKDLNRGTFRSSISSGELLSKLENFYDSNRDSNIYQVSNLNPRSSYNHDNAKNALANLTAGLDSNSELPVMLYTVQDKDFNEGNQRWSVYESRNNLTHSKKSQTNLQQPYSSSSNDYHSITSSNIDHPEKVHHKHDHQSPSSSLSSSNSPNSRNQLYMSQNFNENIGDFRRVQPRPNDQYYNQEQSLSNKPSYGAFSISKPMKNNHLHDKVSMQTSHENMLDQNRPSTNKEWNETTLSGDHSFNQRKESFDKDFDSINDHVTQSWGRFILMMVFGLIIPPLYFLLALGAFDTSSYNRSQYFYQQQYSNLVKQRINKRYSKTQKIISVVFGLFWFAVILAMIGVGFGLGLTREA
ncbi:hypothetical protein HYPBUDRAFT_229430 [Hyphopichia burtonii NRRL Y-1933]|uniref:Uncharacterized protein n=1 Tax=Hyphopichia burtonii NRRL Y-1933 TaxID=984485 RepID=A0A1E4RCP2_9ASCO|nr:hypothetical protein HYPBUDRAFT_229430 [Hyphopichia burtonii NRRL Y-1933]ODV65038.1 hypothetical protein HYPBUDRAFT_229430 [Hyphopichia burtonii NRRL Y-1933]